MMHWTTVLLAALAMAAGSTANTATKFDVTANSASATAVDFKMDLVTDFKDFESDEGEGEGQGEDEGKGVKLSLCSPCVQLDGQALNILLNYILNVGVVGSCGKLCSRLPSKVEQVACELTCSVVGLEAFVKALNHVDLDPIYFCELVHACRPGPNNASATLGELSAEPASVAKGSTIQLIAEVDVKAATGVGEFEILVDSPVTQPVSSTFLLPKGLPVGVGRLGVKLTVQDDESGQFPVIWSPGNYTYTFEVCQGECGSKHPHSKVFGRKSATFQLTAGMATIEI